LPSVKTFKKVAHLKDFIFEIQVRTLNQHAWSNTTHLLSYKQEAQIAPKLQRRVYRLLSLYEIADDEFSAVNLELINHPDHLVYQLLRKTEGKIYKYARIDFDRETSFRFLKQFTSFFTKTELAAMSSEIQTFLASYDKKIQKIFNSNRKRFYQIPFLTQPEIFIVWYALEKYPFTVSDNWSNYFEDSDLDQIQTLWGKVIV
jgi:hypothetical protein